MKKKWKIDRMEKEKEIRKERKKETRNGGFIDASLSSVHFFKHVYFIFNIKTFFHFALLMNDDKQETSWRKSSIFTISS